MYIDKIPYEISQSVLFIGPDYKNHRGGIGAVLEEYSGWFSPFKFIPTYSNNSFFKRQFLFIYALIVYLKRLTFDPKIKIIHINSASRGSFYRKSIFVVFAKIFRKKAILHIHGGKFHLFYENSSRISRSYIKYIFRKSNKIICLSPQWIDFFLLLVPRNKIFVLNNPVKLQPDNNDYNNNGIVQLLFLGKLSENKGIYDLLSAISLLPEIQKNDLRLVIGGNGNETRLMKTIGDLNLQKIVFYKGWVSGKEKETLLKSSDVFILPSYNEGLPVSILEAMSYSKPIITTPVGGIPELVKNEYNGWLFDPGDISGLKQIFNKIICNPDLVKEYGANSKEIVSEFSSANVLHKLAELYKLLMNA